MRPTFKSLIWCGLGLSLLQMRLQSEATASEPTVNLEPPPLLQSTGPSQRLGTSEFRLPRRDGNERMFQFSPDGKLIAACNWDEVRVWTFPDGKLKHDFSEIIDSDCISFGQNGRELLVVDQRERAIVRFDMNSGKLLRKNRLDELRRENSTRYTFLDRGRWLCTTDGRGSLKLFDANTGRLLLVKPSVSGGRRLVANNGILTLSNGSFVDRIDLRTGDRLSRFGGYMKRIDPIFSADGKVAAGYSPEDKAVVFWKTDTNKLIGGKIPVRDREWQSSQAALSTDGKKLVFSTTQGEWLYDRKMAVFDVETGKLLVEFAPPDAYFLDEPILSPDGKWVFPTGERSAFTPVSTETGKPFRETPDHVQEVQVLSFTPDGSTLVVGSRDKRRAWDTKTGAPAQLFEAYYHIPYLATVDNRRALVSGLRDGGLRLQEISTGHTERFFDFGEGKHLSQFQISADRKSFVGVVQSTLRRWDLASGDISAEWTIPAQDKRSWGEEVAGYGPRLALGGTRRYRFDRTRAPTRLPNNEIDWGSYDLLLEDWTTQRVTNRLNIPYYDRFSVADVVDDRTLALVTSDDWGQRASNRLPPGSTYLLVWDVATGWEWMRLERPRPDYWSAFFVAAITPDVRLVATGRNRKEIEIWNGFTGELIQRFDSPMDLTTLTFTDDGSQLASGHIDGTVYIWDTSEAWKAAIPVTELSAADTQECWEQLAGDNPATALQRLLGDPSAAIEMLERNLKPASSSPDIPALIKSEDAEHLIRVVGPIGIEPLKSALKESSSDRTTEKIKRLIDLAALPVAPQLRRRLLGISVAERIGSTKARELLMTLAEGANLAPETQAAIEALKRLGE